jgi:hypothetical protein
MDASANVGYRGSLYADAATLDLLKLGACPSKATGRA